MKRLCCVTLLLGMVAGCTTYKTIDLANIDRHDLVRKKIRFGLTDGTAFEAKLVGIQRDSIRTSLLREGTAVTYRPTQASLNKREFWYNWTSRFEKPQTLAIAKTDLAFLNARLFDSEKTSKTAVGICVAIAVPAAIVWAIGVNGLMSN